MADPDMDDATLAGDPAVTERPVSDAGLGWPARLGHYVMLQELGRGGMGIVCAAYDQVLDRKVAIKLLRGRGDAQAQVRLVREAQALARLSHPNVVQIYEIGELEQLAFIVMEFVDGVTLRNWLRLERRTPEAILAVFDAAGRGLAAAHAQGLIHRDFKPDNVMIRHDGRVLVMDFGLARGEAGEAGTPVAEPLDRELPDVTELGSTLSSSRNQLSVDLTRTGALLGTPAYMAPEQFRGLETDAKTDQFAFCVTAWEALTGARPFAGTNVAALALSVTTGSIAAPSPGLPSWIRKHLERGMATDPAQRWPSLDDLLAALRQDPTRRRRAIVALLGSIAVSLAVVFGIGIARERERADNEAACVAEGQAIAQDWTDKDRAAIEQAFLATDVSSVDETWAHVQTSMDAYAQAWTTLRTTACVETRVAHERDPADYAALAECLDEARTTFATMVDTWHTPTRAQVGGAAVAAAYLPPLSSCSEPTLLAARVRLPDDPATREQVRALRHRLDRTRALSLALDYEAGQREALAVLVEAEALGWAPLVAEARMRLAYMLQSLGRLDEAHAAMREAFAEAGEAGHDLVALEAASALTILVGHRLARPESGLVWSEFTRVLIGRLGLRGSLYEGDYHDHVGIVRDDLGEYQAALESYGRALELREASLGPDNLEVAASLDHLGVTHVTLGHTVEARAYIERALAIRVQLLGPEHTRVAGTLDNLAVVLHAESNYDEARATLERSLAIWRSALGPDHFDVALPLANLGAMQLEQGDCAAALESFKSALAIEEAALGSDHPAVAGTLANMAQAQKWLGDLEGMLSNHARAIEIYERHLEPKHPRFASIRHQYGTALALAGRHEQARVQLEQGLAIGLTQESSAPEEIAATRFALAQSLWELGERELAREQAAIARGLLAADDPQLENITAWMSEHE
jgi:tetratricopeptide (TPR) repeat protein/tRNA A-37 threonylcarbamoyl transferase component Bud32